MTRVALLAYDGVEALDFAGPFEVFTTAARVHARTAPGEPVFEVVAVAAGPGPVRARAGLELLPSATIADAGVVDVLVVPGGVVDGVRGDRAVLDWLARVHATTRLTASVCTGAFVLAAAGILTCGPATTHWEDLDDLAAQFPALEVVGQRRWVRQGRVFTSAGISAGIDLSLHLVEVLAGRELAVRTARQLDYPMPPDA
ncbi:Isonitrile hydratase [Propionicimonas sp. T2.31MG-18]|uniref:DJ-1/PfpI family protein n=1 Tax=Propionicimonas sp. T2.31MG-18 TaxID=3157620 RepID=UPI0035E4D474